MTDYLLHVGVLCLIYATLARSHDLLSGHMGLLTLAHAALFGIGAYTYALLTASLGWPGVPSVVASALAAAVASVAVSIPAVRLGGDTFVLATLAVQMLLWSFAQNASLTGGATGLGGIPGPLAGGPGVNNPLQWLTIAGAVLLLAFFVTAKLGAGAYGRVLHAIREDQILTASLGRNVARYKLQACTISGAVAGLAGSIYAGYTTHIEPDAFDIHASIAIITMVVVGGPASRIGAVLGAFLLISVTECVRFIGVPSDWLGPSRQILYGVLLIAAVVFRPSTLRTIATKGRSR